MIELVVRHTWFASICGVRASVEQSFQNHVLCALNSEEGLIQPLQRERKSTTSTGMRRKWLGLHLDFW